MPKNIIIIISYRNWTDNDNQVESYKCVTHDATDYY